MEDDEKTLVSSMIPVQAVIVNDSNTQRSAGYGLVGVDATYTIALDDIKRLELSAWVDNVADRSYIGSVIVNDRGGRYFEPGLDRTFQLSTKLTL